ncbi:MAG TPA: hypothetical protein PKE12_13565 [Kiritimatiellia bacterium]|nr:hypothetical protein [Kiritimatiellia bacterium]
MSVGIKCTACGHVSPIGRLFCAKCGAKLDVTLIVKDREVSPARRVYRAVRVVFLLALLLALVQLVRPAKPVGETGSAADAAQLATRLNRLYEGHQAGQPVQEIATEREINGYFASLLLSTEENGGARVVAVDLESFNVHVNTNGAVLVWSTRVGKLPVTYEVTGVPGLAGGEFTFEVQRIRAGHLPLPRSAYPWATARLYRLFANLNAERNLLNSLNEIRTGDRRVLARVAGAR